MVTIHYWIMYIKHLCKQMKYIHACLYSYILERESLGRLKAVALANSIGMLFRLIYTNNKCYLIYYYVCNILAVDT